MNGYDPQHFDPAVFMATFGVFMAIALVVGLGITAVICYLLYKLYEAIPAQSRAMEPAKVWLLLIPCFSIVWNFWVYPGLAKSFKAHFDSVNDTSVGDCGAGLALWYCISACLCLIPCVNYIAGPAALILLIIFLVKAHDLKNKIKAA